MKKNYQFKRLLIAIAFLAASHPKGFTYNIQGGCVQTSGYAVAVAATQNSFGEDGLMKVVEYAVKHNIECVGGWFDKKSGRFYFDATVIVKEKKEAIALGRANKQIAIFILNTGREIQL